MNFNAKPQSRGQSKIIEGKIIQIRFYPEATSAGDEAPEICAGDGKEPINEREQSPGESVRFFLDFADQRSGLCS
jgi:hypothetical protein